MLDGELERLRSIMPDAPYTFSKVVRHDWRPFWELSAKIQSQFKGTRHGTKTEHDELWRRFNEIRDEGNRRANEERERVKRLSEERRDLILSKCSGITWSRSTDLMFFFDKTTVEQVKAWGRYLGEAMALLKEYKGDMLTEHKQQCFETFQEIKQSHEDFWAQHRQGQQANREQHQQRRSEIVAKIESNIESNREKRRNASDALRRQLSHRDDLQTKLEEPSSKKWRERHEEWLAEADEKIESIEASIKRIDEWIEDGERRLREFDN